MSALIDDLTNFIRPEDSPDIPTPEWRIEDARSANWALRKIKQIDEQLEEAELLAVDETARITKWIENKRLLAGWDRSFYEAKLHEYLTKLQQKHPNTKSLKLPLGTIRTRKQQPEYQYNEELLLPWAKSNLPAAVAVKELVNKTEIKNHYKDTGEIIPGLTVIERYPKFEVEIKKDTRQPWQVTGKEEI